MTFEKGYTPWNKGKKMSLSTKKKLRKTFFKKGHVPWIKGRRHSPESIALMSKKQTGIFLSEETKKKISRSMAGRTLTVSTRKKISRSITGIRRSKKTRMKISIAQKARFATN